MIIIEPKAVIEHLDDATAILKRLESAGRTCYKSEDKIEEGSEKKFVNMILHERRHESVIEHVGMTVRFVCDRGVSHELVRHRLFAWSQESTRYCNYTKQKFGEQITVIKPMFWCEGMPEYNTWEAAMMACEQAYFGLIKSGAKPQEARSVLPNSLKTEIVGTANMREWRHFFRMRTSKAAHPQMREITIPLLAEVKERVPVLFDDIEVE